MAVSPPRVMAEEPMAPALPSPPASGELSCKASVFLPRSDWCTACTPRLNRRGGLKCRGCTKPRWILDGSSTELTATLAAKKTAEDAGVGAGSRKRKAAVRAKQKVGEALETTRSRRASTTMPMRLGLAESAARSALRAWVARYASPRPASRSISSAARAQYPQLSHACPPIQKKRRDPPAATSIEETWKQKLAERRRRAAEPTAPAGNDASEAALVAAIKRAARNAAAADKDKAKSRALRRQGKLREQEHMEAMAKEHDKLLGARMQRRRAEDMLKWYKERAAHAQWLKAALGKLERYYTRLGVEQEELRAQMAARD